MNKLLLPFLFIVFSANAQQNETVDLKWKITDTVTYKTVIKETVVEENAMQSENDSISDRITDFFKEMQDRISNLKYETKLFPDQNGNVDIAVMIKEEENSTKDTLFSTISEIKGNVVLRGKVNPDGEVLSFYYNKEQNNLTALLFELPNKPVKIGDKWSLNVEMISMDPAFKADSVYKKNEVRLKDVITINKDKIAIIEYDLKEYVSGEFSKEIKSMFSQDQINKTFKEVSHKAISEFNITKGMWLKYEGIMEVKTNFSIIGLGGNNKTEFRLEPLE